MGLIRIAIIIIGFGIIVHMSHWEYALTADNLLKNNVLGDAIIRPDMTETPLEEFSATAYCVTGITRSGAMVSPGHVAADPKIIPLGSMIYVDSPVMGGIYQVLDTGGLIKGKIIDIYIPSYNRCIVFGRRMVKVKVLRYGYLGYPPDDNPTKRS